MDECKPLPTAMRRAPSRAGGAAPPAAVDGWDHSAAAFSGSHAAPSSAGSVMRNRQIGSDG